MEKMILLGISGGIMAHYKATTLIPRFREAGYVVEIILTKNAMRMVKMEEIKRLANIVHTDLFPPDFDYEEALRNRYAKHIDIAYRASIFLIVPATANIIAKLSHGIADDLLTTVALATRAPVLFCPSMNEDMWFHPATQDNVATLERRGYTRVGPRRGTPLSKMSPVGEGCVADNRVILDAVKESLREL